MAKKDSTNYTYANFLIAEMHAEEKAKAIVMAYIPNGAIDGFALEPPPASNMYYDYDIRKWCPNSFKKEKKEMLQREKQRILDETPNPDRPGFSITGNPLPAKQPESMSDNKESSSTVQQEHQCATVPTAPKKAVAKPPNKKAKSKQSASVSESPKQATPLEVISTPADEQPQVNPQNEDRAEPQSETVEQSRKSRRSAKMDEADFAILADRFVHPTDLKDKKPLFFPDELRESLRTVAGLVPGGKVSPSHIAILIVEAWFDEHRELINRMLSNKTTRV